MKVDRKLFYPLFVGDRGALIVRSRRLVAARLGSKPRVVSGS